jgi:hypothetical protein
MAQTIASFLRHVTAFIFEDNPAPDGGNLRQMGNNTLQIIF